MERNDPESYEHESKVGEASQSGTESPEASANHSKSEKRRNSISSVFSKSGNRGGGKRPKFVEKPTPVYFWQCAKGIFAGVLILNILGAICINQLALFNIADGTIPMVTRVPFLLAVSVVSDIIRVGLNIFGACFSGYFSAIKPIHVIGIFIESAIEALGEILFIGFILPSYGGQHSLILLMMAVWAPAILACGHSFFNCSDPTNNLESSSRLRPMILNFTAFACVCVAWFFLLANQYAYRIVVGTQVLTGPQSLALILLSTLLISIKWWANYHFGRLDEDIIIDPEEGPFSLAEGLKTYVAHVTGHLRFESSVLHGVFKIGIIYGAILAYSYSADFHLADVMNGVLRNTSTEAIYLRTALITHMVSAVYVYVLIQLSGRIGLLRMCCALPVVLAPFVTYTLIVCRNQLLGPVWVLEFLTSVLSPLTATRSIGGGEGADIKDIVILIFTWLAGILLGRQIFDETKVTNNLEHYIWHRAEGPGLFVYLNLIFNRNRYPPVKSSNVETRLLFIAVCYWSESMEEMRGSLQSIRRKVEHFVEHYDEEKMRENLEVHLVVDSIQERDKPDVEFRPVYNRLMKLIFGVHSVWRTSDLKPQLISTERRSSAYGFAPFSNWYQSKIEVNRSSGEKTGQSFGIHPTDYGLVQIYQFGDNPRNPRLYIHFKDGERGCFTGSKRLSMGLYFLEVEKRIQEIAIEREWATTWKELKNIYKNSFIFTADGDTLYSGAAVRNLYEYIYDRPNLAGVSGTVIPIGDGPLAWFQEFEYFSAHIFNKTTEFMIGTVLCLPGCFSIYRFSNLQEVMRTYRTGCTQALDLLVRQQGEDRWLTTLLTFKGHRLGYLSVPESLTHCPTSFDVLMNQRRRWITSSFANLWCLLTSGSKLRSGSGLADEEEEDDHLITLEEKGRAALYAHEKLKEQRRRSMDLTRTTRRASVDSVCSKASSCPMTVAEDDSPSERDFKTVPLEGSEAKPARKEEKLEEKKYKHPGSSRYIQWMFLLYALINFVSAVISPAMISILVTGGALGLGLPLSAGLAFGVGPPLFYVLWCLIYDNNKAGEGNPFLSKQLFMAQILAFMYVFVVAAIMVGVGRVVVMDPRTPGSIFLVAYAGSFVLAGIVHGKIKSILCGLVYLFFGPTMYQILMIFAFFSFNDISWGTRMNGQKEQAKDPIVTFFSKWLEQPLINWICRCYAPKPNTNEASGKTEEIQTLLSLPTSQYPHTPSPVTEKDMENKHEEKKGQQQQQLQQKQDDVHITIRDASAGTRTPLADNSPFTHSQLRPSDRLSDLAHTNNHTIGDEHIDLMKSLAEKEWSIHHQTHKEEIQQKKISLQIDVIQPNSEESKQLLLDLTKMKKNVLWVVLAANMAFYTLVVALSSFQDFFIWQTNVFSLGLLFLFGGVQIVQGTCMLLDGVKSLTRRMSYV